MSEQTRLVKKLRKIQTSISPGSELFTDVQECLAILGEDIELPRPAPKVHGLILPDAEQIERGNRPSTTGGMITTQSLGYGSEPSPEDIF